MYKSGKNKIKYSKEFDNFSVKNVSELEISKEDIISSLDKITKEELEALKFAKHRIEEFCKKQKLESWSYISDEIKLGEKITAIEKVGIYVPGGSAVYPSSAVSYTHLRAHETPEHLVWRLVR